MMEVESVERGQGMLIIYALSALDNREMLEPFAIHARRNGMGIPAPDYFFRHFNQRTQNNFNASRFYIC